MRHQRQRRKLGVKSQHRIALLRNLVRNLVIHKRIQTTYAKAKEASSFADKMVTVAKRGDLAARRLLISRLGSADVAKQLMLQIAPHFKERAGGYTRVLRTGYRKGDASEMALLEFTAVIESPDKPKKPKKEKKSKEVKEAKVVESKPEKKSEISKKKTAKEKDVETSQTADSQPDKKESDKKGGFLGALRKFLKGDEK